MSACTNVNPASETKARLLVIIDTCSEEELRSLLPIIESVLETLRAKDSVVIKQKKSQPPGVIWKLALRLDVWLFAFNHFQFYDVDFVFSFALWTEQREVQKNRILIDHRPCLCSALRASDPKCRAIIRHGFIYSLCLSTFSTKECR